MGKPDPVQPPNPIDTARASTSTNVSTAIANSYLGNINQVTPWGSLTYSPSSSYSWTDPTTQANYSIPTFTATQELSQQGKDIQNLNAATQMNMAGLGASQSYRLSNLLGTPFDYNGAPGTGDMNALYNTPYAQYGFGDVGGQQRQLGDAGAITRSYGPQDSFSADRGRVEEALYGRLNPQLEKDRARVEQQLADQGIRYGSPAYAAAMDDYNRQSTDARLAVTQAGGAEQQRMMDMAAKQAGFQNEAQAQKFQQLLQGGTFANQAQQQEFQQAALRGQFGNSAAAQNLARNQSIFDAQNQQRQNWQSEQFALRNQPINEITALLSGSQVQQPSFVNTPQNNIATTDVAGLINNKFSQDMSNYQQQNANFNSMMGGIFGALGGLAKSDRREKEDIDRIGTIFAAGDEGKRQVPIYEYAYKDDPTETRHTGPMAQDIEKVDRKAVKTVKGVKHIDMTRLGSILKVA